MQNERYPDRIGQTTGQISENDWGSNMKKIRVIEWFSGYGGGSFALTKADIPHEVVAYSEVDKYAILCYEQNHLCKNNLGDISKVEPDVVPDSDLWMAGPPCQDVSIAGKRDLRPIETKIEGNKIAVITEDMKCVFLDREKNSCNIYQNKGKTILQIVNEQIKKKK